MAAKPKKSANSSPKISSAKITHPGLPTAVDAPPPVEFTKEQELAAYREMLLIRRFEEKAGQLYGMGFIGGFCHLYIGQEAVVIGMQMAMIEGDQVITGYRDHGHMLAMGMNPRGVMAELTGRRGGYSRGKGGSMHMFSKEKHFYGGHGIVGAQVSLGTGLAFANRYRGNDNVAIAYFGDGAANQGQVYESFNMAALWKLPVIYVIENNRYAMGTSVSRASAQTDFSQRGASFNIPGMQVDGMDVRAVKAAGEHATEWCRSGKGPIILEMQTYRYRGHSMSDPAKYRTKEEVQKMRSEHDPIEQVKARLHGEELGQRGRPEGDRQGSPRHRRRGRGVRAGRSGAGCIRALDRHSALSLRGGPENHADEILMPALSPTMEEGNLSKWLKKEGDKVTSGDVIAEIETDKATMEVEAVDEGTIGKILIAAGTEGVKVNTPIAVLLPMARAPPMPRPRKSLAPRRKFMRRRSAAKVQRRRR